MSQISANAVDVVTVGIRARQGGGRGGIYPRAHFYFLLALLTAFVGFYPSYFSRLGDTDGVHHFHGLTATAWLCWLIVQAWLIRRGSFAAHKIIGWLSLVVAPAFVVSGILLIQIQTFAPNPFSVAFGVPLAFIDGTTIGYFAVAYVMAIVYRRNVQLHARLLASTAVMVLPPAISRVIGNLVTATHSFPLALYIAFALSEIIVVLLLIDDYRHGSIRAPYVILFVLMLVQPIGFQLLL